MPSALTRFCNKTMIVHSTHECATELCQQLDSIFLQKAKIQIDCDRSQALESEESLHL
jgi:hypothetical protein